MTNQNDDTKQPSQPEKKRRISFFVGVTGGILIGAMVGNVGAGVAIGISLWLIGVLIENKRGADRQDQE
jgi:uncharacterized membrane protein